LQEAQLATEEVRTEGAELRNELADTVEKVRLLADKLEASEEREVEIDSERRKAATATADIEALLATAQTALAAAEADATKAKEKYAKQSGR
jgi:hypothetical protein